MNQQSPKDPALKDLKRLILGDEQEALSDVQERLDDPQVRQAEIARVLPKALRSANREDTEQLVNALQEPVGECIKQAVRGDTRMFADALFPVMGPAIRKAITEALRGMVDSINNMLEQSLSAQGLAWRWESIRTGTPFPQIVMRNTMLYRVEQVFLIQPESGLLMAYASADEGTDDNGEGESDQVSAMLTAIQDFMRDAFERGERRENLGTVTMGDRNVWLVHGPYGYIAAVIEGVPPQSLRELLEEVLEDLHKTDAGSRLEAFQGDRDELVEEQEELRRCLSFQLKNEAPKQKKLPIPFLVGAGVLLLLLGWWVFQQWQEQRARDALRVQVMSLVEKAEFTPGIDLSTPVLDGETWRLLGFHDPLAQSPESFIEEPSEAIDIRWRQQISLDEALVLKRAKAILAPPEGIRLSLKGGILSAEGIANDQWLDDARLLARAVPGVVSLDGTGLRDWDVLLLEQVLQSLQPPKEVKVTVQDAKAHLQGIAPRQWLKTLPGKLEAIEGLKGWDDSEVEVLEKALLAAIEMDVRPPEDVNLEVSGRVLKLSGVAPEAWLTRLDGLEQRIDGLNEVDREALQGRDDYLLQLAKTQLQAPKGVHLRVKDTRLTAEGEAPIAWLRSLRSRSAQVSGLTAVDDRGLRAQEIREWITRVPQVDAVILQFVDYEELDEASIGKLNSLVERLADLERLAQALAQEYRVVLTGFTDSFGSVQYNRRLSRKRAELVAGMLVERGVRQDRLVAEGNTPEFENPKRDQSRRRVTVRVEVPSPNAFQPGQWRHGTR